jgi:hypothetical protein
MSKPILERRVVKLSLSGCVCVCVSADGNWWWRGEILVGRSVTVSVVQWNRLLYINERYVHIQYSTVALPTTAIFFTAMHASPLQSAEPEFVNIQEAPGTDSAGLCSLAGRYNNPIPTRFLAPWF